MQRKEKVIMGLCVIATLSAGAMHFAHANQVLTFITTAVALALLAVIVGDATEQLGSRLGPGATGVCNRVSGILGTLLCIFALRAGLDHVVQAALIGSILGNSVLVLGLALFVGGLKNGTQRFNSEPPKMIVTLMLLAAAALVIPTLAHQLHTPAEAHILSLDEFLAVILLVLLAANIYFSIKGDPAMAIQSGESAEHEKWSLKVTIIVLAVSGLGAALVSDWFVEALQPAMNSLGISETFAGLVVVAVAGNAIENLIGIQLAWRNQADYAISVVQNSSLQIALGLFPVLVLLSYVLGGAILTFILSPMLVAVLLIAVIVSAFVVYDGESIWLEGLALVGLYCIIASAFWWG